MSLTPELEKLARLIWDYHHLGHTLTPADVILGLGSHDVRVADRAAELYLEGLAPYLCFTGALGNLTLGVWDRPEAEIFKDRAVAMGVPEDRILVENQATNTGENFTYSKKLLADKGLAVKTMILVQKPYMERRTYATCKVQWPEPEVRVTSPQLSFDDYPNEEISKEDVVHIMTGDLERIRAYPEKGFQIPQDIPEEVWAAYEKLVAAGFTRNAIKP